MINKNMYIRLVLVFFIAIIGLTSGVYAAFFPFSGTTGTAHILGSFFDDGIKGNAGTIEFEHSLALSPGIATGGLERGYYLTGSFYLQTVGWATFDSGSRIKPPPSDNVTDLWSLSGTATSIYAGKIYFNSGLYQTNYDPINRSLSGTAWNLGVGRLTFESATSRIISTEDNTDPDIIRNRRVSRGFVGSVKIIGSMGGNSTYDTFYNIGPKINVSLFTDRINQIRKNVALLTRNLPSQYENSTNPGIPKVLDNKLFFINQTTASKTLTYHLGGINSVFENSIRPVKGMILVGYDLIIDGDIANPEPTKPSGIILLKNKYGTGGNIVITSATKKIQTSLVAEGTLYSGDSMDHLYNDTTESVALLSETASGQLYIRGSVFSRNTIGGAIQVPQAACVYGESECTYARAIRYDLNYFRAFGSGDTLNRSYPDATLDDYSVIIELDPAILANPPPGL